MRTYLIRPMNADEIPMLEAFLYHAIFQRDKKNFLPRKIIYEPEIYVYIKDFGKPDDHCLVAEVEGALIGAIWARILTGEVRGFGNIDEETPELAISLMETYRNKGIGTKLIQKMITL